MKALESKIPPPIVMLLIGGLMWMVSGKPAIRITGFAATAAAFVLAAVGMIVELAGLFSFLRARTTFDPIHPQSATRLVVTGIYRFTRNPMYLGDLILLLAWAAFLARPLALVFTPLFVLYINRFQIKPEERALSALFGNRYEEYKSRVRRWL